LHARRLRGRITVAHHFYPRHGVLDVPEIVGREFDRGRGEAGQIDGRGACLMLGYFDNQAATEGSFKRGG